MKRISFWLVLLALTPGITEAYCYSSYCYGVRYSPYAFNYRHSGLVSGVDYTPYAYTYRNSGLVPGYGLSSGSYSNDYVSCLRRPFQTRPRGPAFHGTASRAPLGAGCPAAGPTAGRNGCHPSAPAGQGHSPPWTSTGSSGSTTSSSASISW